MEQRIETTLIVDGRGGARLEGPVAVPAGRHRVTVVVADAVPDAAAAWQAYIDRTYGSLAGIDFARPPQGDYEQRAEIA